MPHIPRSGLPHSSASRADASPDAPLPRFPGPVVELDVREDLRNGREPFSRIMASVDALAPDEALLLRATFEPAPLFRVLGKRGYDHHSVAHSDDDWSIWFYPSGDAASTTSAPSEPAAASAATPGAAAAAGNEILLDVRGLEPPEPMVRTLEALETLPAGAVLVQHNDRVPQFLLPILAERGFHHEVDTTASDGVLVRISRASDANPPARPDAAGVHAPTTATPTSRAIMPPTELDVRVIPPRDKHPTIFRTFDALASGQSMLLINDHDPAPLRYQLLAERPDSFDWTYEARGPEEWRVLIARR
ncbi:MAG: DUF2249 domain-containing protein [Gemmatimonadaceae bacterium]